MYITVNIHFSENEKLCPYCGGAAVFGQDVSGLEDGVRLKITPYCPLGVVTISFATILFKF
jgi:hypothetical protein